jgi:ribonuclease HII
VFPSLTNRGAENDNFHFERELQSRGWKCIAGTDEAGRGPLAGPVVAACVSLSERCDPAPFLDSKKISAKQRLHLYEFLRSNGSAIGVGVVSHKRIDAINILQASLLAMKLAVFNHAAMSAKVIDFLLVDGKFEVPIETPQLALIKGESKSGSIAAASIIAKVYRDRIMDILHQKYPQYDFHQNRGYPTKNHRQAIARYGACPFHRMTFKGVREFVS